MVNLFIESGVIFAVLYALAALTYKLDPQLGESVFPGQIALTTVLFAGGIQSRRKLGMTHRPGLTREIILVSLISLFVGLAGFGVLWIMFNSPRNLTGLIMLEAAIAVPISIAAWRWMSTRWQFLDICRERIVIVGTGETAREVCRAITQNHGTECVVVGFVDETDDHVGRVLAMGVRILTDFDSMTEALPKRADRILVALNEKRGKLPAKQLIDLKLRGLEIEEAISFFERVGGKIAVETLLPSWLIFSEGFKSSPLRSFSKRTIDVCLSSMQLVISMPLVMLTALAIRIDSPGKVLFRQRRTGLNGKEFDLLKFRSMVEDAESKSGPTWAREDDPRITRVGRVIRTLRIDELPQLINILKGEMSFVGPRPERPVFVKQLEERIPYYGLRHAIRPGLTGWAQVQYAYSSSVEETEEKLRYDLFYVKNNSILLDMWIVLKTIKVVLQGSGSR
jgi:sugar transferase (PEP-CTERM system associated)